MRLDIYVSGQPGVPSRSSASNLIRSGKVTVNNVTVTKCGYEISESDTVCVTENLKYVSRGGLKLEKALSVFSVDPRGLVCLDAGASTGGFTDCLIQNGALKVYAVDVGTSQLHPSLKNDPRVLSFENTDIRNLDPSVFPVFDMIVCDLSFISLRKVISSLAGFLASDGRMICLFKPQFEYGRQHKGVIRDFSVHRKLLSEFVDYVSGTGVRVSDISFSPVTGGDGNVEYLLLFSKNPNDSISNVQIDATVDSAVKTLKVTGSSCYDS